MLGLCKLDGLPMRLAHGQYELTAFFHLGVGILSFYLRSSRAENDLVDEGGRCLFLLFTNSFRFAEQQYNIEDGLQSFYRRTCP